MIVEIGNYYLYRHTRLDTNQPFYIGIGTKPNWNASCQEKMYRRAFTNKKRSDFWKRIVNKYRYKVEILLESSDYKFIKEKEIEFIKLYGRINEGGILCNITKGGDGTHGFSRTPEINKNIGLKISGKNNKKSIFAYKYNKEGDFIDSYESFNLAAKANSVFKQNILEAKNKGFLCGGFYWSDKLYTNFIKESPLYESKEDIVKRSALNRTKPCKGVVAYNIDNSVFKVFDCVKDATLFFTGKLNNKRNSNIEHAINGRYKTAYNYKWTWR